MENNSRIGWYSDDRDSPPTDTSDLIFASFPIYSAIEASRRQTQSIAKLDQNMLESLHKVGFRTNLGPEGTGLMMLIPDRAGGYYLGGFFVEVKLNPTNHLLQTPEQAHSLRKEESS